jgi:hypothetical protein
MRIAASVTAASFLFAVATGLTEAGLHGFNHFVFRPSGIGSGGTETDQQFVDQQAAAAKAAAAKAAAKPKPAPKKATAHKAHRPGRHSAKTTSGS